MTIETKPLERPFSLRDIAKHFSIKENRLHRTLEILASSGKIFDHDLEMKSDGDVQVSTYAATLLLSGEDTGEHPGHEGLLKMANFFEGKAKGQTSGDFLATTYINVKILACRIEILERERSIEMQSSNKGLGELAFASDLLEDAAISIQRADTQIHHYIAQSADLAAENERLRTLVNLLSGGLGSTVKNTE